MTFLVLFFYWGCHSDANKGDHILSGMEFKQLEGGSVTLSEIKNSRGALFFFLSPECPLCRQYGQKLREYGELAGQKNLQSYAVFPGTFYSNAQIADFRARYSLQMPFILDPDYHLAHYLKASITPEAFLLDSLGNTKYFGAIDNWAYEVGRTRQKATEFYLDNALSKLLSGEQIIMDHTDAIGCFIE